MCNARGIALRRVTPDALSDGNSGLVAAIDALFLAISHQMPLARPKDLPLRKESTRLRLRFDAYGKSAGLANAQRLKAFILLLRYSGMRVGDSGLVFRLMSGSNSPNQLAHTPKTTCVVTP